MIKNIKVKPTSRVGEKIHQYIKKINYTLLELNGFQMKI